MHAFEFYQPTAITFGPGTEEQAGAKAAQLGAKRVLVVYGGESAKRSGLLDRVLASLEEAGLAILSANISQKMLINADRSDDPMTRKFLMRQDSLSVQCSSLYKTVPYMSDRCRDAVRRAMSSDPDSDDPSLPAPVDDLDEFEAECVHRAEGIMATYRRNRRLMYDIIVEGFLENGPVATTRS